MLYVYSYILQKVLILEVMLYVYFYILQKVLLMFELKVLTLKEKDMRNT